MNPRQIQGYLLPLLVIVAGYCCADLAAAVAEDQLTRTDRPASASSTNTVSNSTRPGNVTATNAVSLSSVAAASELTFVFSNTAAHAPTNTSATGNLVMPNTTLPPGAGNSTAAPSGPLPKLTGTLAGGGHSLAVLQSGDETKVVGVGELVNGYTVTEVSTFSATLRDPQGGLHRLSLDLAQSPSGPITPANVVQPSTVNTTPANVAMAAPIASDTTLSQRELRTMLDNPGEFMTQMQIKPIKRNDDLVGVQVNMANPAKNPLARLGVVTGDVVTSLNGHPLKGAEDLQWALSEIRNSTQLNFNVERNGIPVPLNVRLTE